MTEILSRQNAKFKGWRALLDGRGIKKAGLAIFSGRKLVEEYLRAYPERAVEILTAPKLPSLTFPQARSYRLGGDLFRELDVLGTDHPLLVVQVDPIPEWRGEAPQGLELIVALSDPGNLGAVLRSAEAFGVTRVILCEEACSPYLPKSLRAASGATFRLPMARTGPLKAIKTESLYALNMEGESLHRFRWPENLHLVLGEEGRGVPEELQCQNLQIPMARPAESLNAMAAASIAMYAYNENKTI